MSCTFFHQAKLLGVSYNSFQHNTGAFILSDEFQSEFQNRSNQEKSALLDVRDANACPSHYDDPIVHFDVTIYF